MIHLIALLESSQDRDRVLNSRFIYHDGLESSLQRSILFDVLSVLLESCRADAVQFAPCQHGFEHISGVHSAFRFACAHNGVKLVDKEYDLAVTLAHILQYGFKSLLEFTSVFCPCYQGAHIEGKDLLVLKSFRHIALSDTLRKTLYDRCLADTGFTDQNRIVLGLSGQDTDHITDLRVSSDDRIKLLVPGLSYEFLAVLGQSVIGRLGVIRCNSLIAPYCRQRFQESVPCNAIVLEQFGDHAVRVSYKRQEEVLNTYIFIAELLRFVLRADQDLVEVPADINS